MAKSYLDDQPEASAMAIGRTDYIRVRAGATGRARRRPIRGWRRGGRPWLSIRRGGTLQPSVRARRRQWAKVGEHRFRGCPFPTSKRTTASDDYDERYTDPKLRRRLKDEIQAGDKGGDPGQWSARKSQLLVRQYTREGGGYLDDEQDAAARSLRDWAEQEWQTRDGSARADGDDGTRRYLPADAWALLLERDQDAAEASKAEADGAGEPFADWPQAVRDVMTELEYLEGEDSRGLPKDYLSERARELDLEGRSSMTKDELKDAIRASRS